MRYVFLIAFLFLLFCTCAPVLAEEPSQEANATLLWEEYISPQMNAIVLSGDGAAVACAGNQGMKLLSGDGGTCWMTELSAHEIACSDNASRVLVGSSTLHLYNQTGAEIWRNGSDYFVLSDAISPAGDLVYSAWDDSKVLCYNMTSMTVQDLGINIDLICMGVTDNGAYIVGGTLTGDLILWDRSGTVKWTRTYPGEKAVQDLALSSEGNVITYTIDDQVYLINRAGRTLWNAPLPHAAGVSMSADGSCIAVAHANGISIFNREGTLTATLQKGRDMLDVSLDNDGKKLAACDQKNAYYYVLTPKESENSTNMQKSEESQNQPDHFEATQDSQATPTLPVASGNGMFSVFCVTGSILVTVFLCSRRHP